MFAVPLILRAWTTLALVVLAPLAAAQTTQVDRFPSGPILTPTLVGDRTAHNYDRESTDPPFISIAGPSLIRVPEWIEQPLGRYYLYFAHHKGGHIRMAYADELAGPWTVYDPGLGVLRLVDVADLVEDHIASPDVHVDHEHRAIRMYFHGPRRGIPFDQRTWLATSRDGLSFTLHSDEALGRAYFRTFRWGGYDYTPARLGPISRSHDGDHNFEVGPTLFGTEIRHYGMRVHNNRAYFFFSRRTEVPERIRLRTLDLSEDWSTWSLSPSTIVLSPTETYEISHGAKVLDPCLYQEDGQSYLLYSISDERGIAIAKLTVDEWAGLNVNRIRARSSAPYRLADAGLALGDPLFVDSAAVVAQAPGELLGAQVLLTAMEDVRSAPLARFLSFDVDRRARVWVAHDDRLAARPEWLASWTATGTQLTVDDGSGPFTMSLFHRDVASGPVVLGGNVDVDEPLVGLRAMYGVFVTRTP